MQKTSPSRPSRQKRVSLKCRVCSTPYWAHAYREQTSKYCSKACWAQRATKRPCEHCGTTFKVIKSERERFCSKRCMGNEMRGPKAAHWTTGSSLARQRGVLGSALDQWRRAVFNRDHYACQHCGRRQHLQAHHIKSFAGHPALRLVVANGLTLCIDCHGLVHNRDFSNQRSKVCPDCGTSTAGRGVNGRCLSCAIGLWHASRRLNSGEGFSRTV